jgi:predicted ATPase/class 3 adenylate cyclase
MGLWNTNMPVLPSGTVTFLFTDIQGSTRLWEQHPEAMRAAMTRHDALAAELVIRHDGVLVKPRGEGDSLFFVFSRATDALACACAFQQALCSEPWPSETPLRVRMALHTGEADLQESDYYGVAVNRCARLRAIGHGGQVLLSAATQELVRDILPPSASLESLGEHRLRDLSRPETVFQLRHPDLPAGFSPLNSLDNPALPNNLPLQLTSFVGREKEIAEVKTLLEKTRLLTLTGSGGCGKTRLSLQVAADMLEQYPDGVLLVELAPLSDPALVPQTVALALGLTEQTGKTFVQTLTNCLKSKRLLLVLDNCEHLLPACAQLCDVLLRSCPNLTILASSREGLGIAGELTYRVPSLALPDPKQRPSLEQVSQYEAVRLFIERAQFHQPAFMVTNQSAPALAAICHHLDGIPLAIELAAARVRSLSVEEINTRLDNRFRLLTGGSKTALPRQQTLRALIDWSYDLLNGQEKLLVARLSVFAGGWTLDAAERVCAGESEAGEAIEEWEVLDLLTSLIDKSLVIAETQGQSSRYRLLETVRQYAQERLKEQGEAEQVRTGHRDHYLARAEEAEPHLRGAEQGHWLAVLDAEHDNLRQVLAFCLEDTAGVEAGLRLVVALCGFWDVRGHYGEGRAYLAAALARETGPEQRLARAHALDRAGNLAWRQSDYAASRALLEESLTLYRELGDRRGTANSLDGLGRVALNRGDYAASRALLEESLTLFRELGNKHSSAVTLANLGNLAHAQGDYSAARTLYEESLTLFRELGNRLASAQLLGNLGAVVHAQGDYSAARTLYEESLTLFRELGNRLASAIALTSLGGVACNQSDYAKAAALFAESLEIRRELGDRQGIAESLDGVANLARQEQQPLRAVRLWGAAASLREAIGLPRSPREQERYEREMAQARAAPGEDGFTTAWEEGRAMTWEQAVDYALETETTR